MVLSIARMLGYLGEVFHRRSHLWCICSFIFCRIAEILEGNGFLRILGSKLTDDEPGIVVGPNTLPFLHF